MKHTLFIASLLAISCTRSDASTRDDTHPMDSSAARDVATPITVVPRAARPGSVVFVVAMENRGQASIYGNTKNAPYINDVLLPRYAHTLAFHDELPTLPSEPHYVWIEAGSNAFADYTFTGNMDASERNSTSHPAHLATQLEAAHVSWRSYQEGMKPGICPIRSAREAFYVAKHNPFVFFQDIVGSPPSETSPKCIAHHKPLDSLLGDLAAGTVARYNFVTPNQCHDMHGDRGCDHADDSATDTKAGDDWLRHYLPPMIAYANAHDGYIFVEWDEPDGSSTAMPFIALAKNARRAYASDVEYTHSSLLKTIEEILGVPILPSVRDANDLADLFTHDSFP